MPMQPQTFSAWKRRDGKLVGLTVIDPNPAPCSKITNAHITVDIHTDAKWVQVSAVESYGKSGRSKRTHLTLDPAAARRLYEVMRDVFEPTKA